ncbi:MAG: sigma-70 family RNA polymerase sigma factor [Bacteroidota bacterium]|nr:sigma-70 family RNA polymerase sigma factor [Bacteroidota bacterium]MDP4225540.1 sigma-70 family RNA polymerase sigma factor [Bacteroidota bacterium]MDP4273507.1 sigma-70 family RNA polymerase sigma factor [Bacteroidota bacterium]
MEASNFSDQELIEQSIAGNQKSLELLINRYRRKVFTYILLVVGDRQLAEDIFQDTFIKVINSLKEGKYQDNGRFLSWVTRIAHNLVIDYFRKEKQLSTVSDDDCDVSVFNTTKLAEANIEDSMVRDQIMEDVRSLIEQLPADQREVIMLRHYMGLSFKEIAEQTNVSINTALGRMRYALINLRKLIDEKHLLLTK